MFKQLLEELAKIREEVVKKINDVKSLQQEVDRLTKENEVLNQENVNLRQEIEEHVCPDNTEEIEVLKTQISSIQVEKENQQKTN